MTIGTESVRMNVQFIACLLTWKSGPFDAVGFSMVYKVTIRFIFFLSLDDLDQMMLSLLAHCSKHSFKPLFSLLSPSLFCHCLCGPSVEKAGMGILKEKNSFSSSLPPGLSVHSIMLAVSLETSLL